MKAERAQRKILEEAKEKEALEKEMKLSLKPNYLQGQKVQQQWNRGCKRQSQAGQGPGQRENQ